LALIVAVLTGIAALGSAFYGSRIADNFYQLLQELPMAVERARSGLAAQEWGTALLDRLASAGTALSEPQSLARIAGVLSTAVGALGSLVVVIVLGIYFAAGSHTYIDGTVRLFPVRHRPRARDALLHLGVELRWWLIGRGLAMVAVGTLTGIGLWLLGVPFAFVLGLLAALLDFIPNIGPLIAAAPAVLVGFSESGTTALYVAVLYAGVQTLEGFLISPLLQQRLVSLPPALLLASQLVLGAGLGLLGLLLAAPLAVVALKLVPILYEPAQRHEVSDTQH
jgi:predicted PurR-regulated permease PerM